MFAHTQMGGVDLGCPDVCLTPLPAPLAVVPRAPPAPPPAVAAPPPVAPVHGMTVATRNAHGCADPQAGVKVVEPFG